MSTTVIHINQSTRSDDEVYIGRAGKGQPGLFGNPVVIGKPCVVCNEVHSNRGSTLPCYEEYLLSRLAVDQQFAKKFSELKNKTLVCFCKPQFCHGDIMAKVLDREQL